LENLSNVLQALYDLLVFHAAWFLLDLLSLRIIE